MVWRVLKGFVYFSRLPPSRLRADASILRRYTEVRRRTLFFLPSSCNLSLALFFVSFRGFLVAIRNFRFLSYFRRDDKTGGLDQWACSCVQGVRTGEASWAFVVFVPGFFRWDRNSTTAGASFAAND
jgi:hypothetical protein